MSNSQATVNFEVVVQSGSDEALVFTSDSEQESIGFATNYAHRHRTVTVMVVEDRFDPKDRLFKRRRVWSRPPVTIPPRGQRARPMNASPALRHRESGGNWAA